MWNWKETTKQLCARIKINNNRVRMILMPKKRLRAHPKIRKRHRIVTFIYMNAVKHSALKPSNARAQNSKQKSAR